MVRINFEISDIDYINFQQKVGKGNVAASLRQYIKSCISSGDEAKEEIIRRKYLIIKEEKDRIDLEHDHLKSKLEAIEKKKKAEEVKKLEKLEKEKKKMKNMEHDTIKTHLHKVFD